MRESLGCGRAVPTVSMFDALKNAVSRKLSQPTRLTAHHLDSPQADFQVDRPELLVRGWLVFNQEPPRQSLQVVLEAGGLRLPLSLQTRADVQATYPAGHCVGFNQLLDLASDFSDAADLQDEKMQIRVSWSGGEFVMPLALEFDDDYQQSNSYFASDLQYSATDVVSHEQIDHWRERGYLLLPKFFSEDEVDRINADIDHAWERRDEYPATVTVDQQIGTAREQRLALKDTDPAVRSSPYKLNDLYQESGAIRDVVLNERLMQVMTPLIGGTPMICNSLSFEYGSQQPHHFDTFYMPPTIRNHMLASWIALEDVHPDAGPLEYFPGSHTIEPYRSRDGSYNLTADQRPDFNTYIARELENENLQQETFCASKGDVFIWHAHLFHGGSRIVDEQRTRKSLVTHYFCREDWSPDQYEEFAPGRCYLKRL